jgi:hypothetical protein
MALAATPVPVWAADIEDSPGGLAGKLRALADAGANLEVVIARRSPEEPGKGVVFVTPIQGDAQTSAAREAGFERAGSLHSVRVQGPDAPGLGAQIAEAIAEAGINMRGFSAAAVGGQCVVYLGFDSADDAARAVSVVEGVV